MSAITRDELQSMTADELRSYGETEHNIQFKARDTKDTIIDRILAAENGGDPENVNESGTDTGDDPSASGNDPAPGAPDPEPSQDDDDEDDEDEDLSDVEQQGAAKDAKRVRITLAPGQGPEGDDPQKVSVNGYMYVIPRNQEVAVPREVVDVLKNAIYTETVSKGRNEDGSPKYVDRDVPRFNLQVHGPAE